MYQCFTSEKILLHLHEIVEGFLFIYTSVCLSACVRVCGCLSVKKNSIERMHWFGAFSYHTGSDPIEISVKGQGHSDAIYIFSHNSLITSLLLISALLCLIKTQFGMSLRYALDRFEFHRNQMDDDFI